MRWKSTLKAMFRRKRIETDLDDEIRDHMESEVASNIAAGMPYEEACFAAKRLIGPVALYKEQCRDARRIQPIESLVRNLRFAVRTLRRSPLFTIATVLTLALAIGANTALFSIANQMLLRTLPV